MNEVPDFLLNKLNKYYNKEDVERIINGYKSKRKTTFRVNTIKSSIDEIKQILEENNILYKQVPWYEEAFILDKTTEKEISKLDIYKEGKIYLQSLSSMIPAIIVSPMANENILDMCSAPGGKTTQMSALSKNTSLITACEKNKIRADRLQYNIQKQGTNKITILREDARKLSKYFSFDKILLDAPCSGSGTINVNSINQEIFTEELITRSIKIQQTLLKKAVSLLKSGHVLIYSTCSILKEENEDNIQMLLNTGKMKIVPISKQKLGNLPLLPSKIEGTITICPTELYEGFFVAKLVKM